ncbi:preprotein translocase subunit SecA [Candidatus Roizmanbacteria bacterium CG_4_10_14_0_8_um_filter_36_36]|nr:MAG: preprotein translocase subunit SecA [Candidatus Roizmanbacteria bacterium CG03_land_8_20_14_0_80_36_21]PIY69617.1 MAG: preprotein translocase subunit SecA [Candidatus Roizmanbacteria bacterium CG_4_10_14_0_8_um_filter_36_36]PJA53673.1 MAG: preprotein translocase subunit SecA [Candidatus Roizmanbacteria bacterium CG_4_9_14_3_um_filter_36_11]
MLNFLKKFFDYNERELVHYRRKVEEINDLEDKARKLKDQDFSKETNKLREKIKDGEALNNVLPWSFALVREAARRLLDERHFDVQLIAGISLHEGKVAEQKTGEGKTLSATAALYLNALTGKGAHLVTVNDYLARRDCGWMGTIFHFLGLSTAAIVADRSYIFDPVYQDKEAVDWRLVNLRPISRKEAYLTDITYGINSEFGFDYLRDNMAQTVDHLVQRDFNYAIIDEADSILIDEARTPHIISAPYEEDVSKYYQYAKIVRRLDSKTDFKVDEKSRTANLTEEGIKKLESLLGVNNIYEKDFDTLFHVEAALKAQTLFKIDKDYIIKDNEVIIVDEFTGRLLPGRRFSEGIHQAIEAKENVNIQKESKTLATISLQNYFRMYKKLAGMTGTAATEAEEFHKIYSMDVLIVPTNRPMVRRDFPDSIYKTEKGKFNAVAEEIAKNYKLGRPVLVGTTSIEKNENLSKILKAKGVPHQLLNAKQHEKEALILAEAGKKGAVTVATNMAGRGVDIVLGGIAPSKYQLKIKSEKLKVEKQRWQKEHDEIIKLGGLYVIGTERHESRRIDNQLRGRAGRQGDPGETRFFVALNDDLMRIFGGEQISRLMTFFNFPEDQPLSHSMVSRAIEQAQVKVEGFNFDIRKHLVDFDDVLNKQREIIYGLRRDILLSLDRKEEEFRQTIFKVFNQELNLIANNHFALNQTFDQEASKKLVAEINFITAVDSKTVEDLLKSRSTVSLVDHLNQLVKKEYENRENKLGKRVWNEITRMVFISTVDKYWTEHLTSIEDLREGINLRGYAQLDPLVEYKNEAYSMFERLVADINFEATRRLFKVEVSAFAEATGDRGDNGQAPMIFKSASAIDPFKSSPTQPHLTTTDEKNVESSLDQPQPTEVEGFKVIPPGTKSKKLGRNDPCWCGSGKKYKRCHYPN